MLVSAPCVVPRLYHYEPGSESSFFVNKVTPYITLCVIFKDEQRSPRDEDVKARRQLLLVAV